MAAAPNTFLSTLEADLAKIKAMGVITAPFKMALAPLVTAWQRLKGYVSQPSSLVVDVALVAAGVFLAMWLWGASAPSKPHVVMHKPAPMLGFLGM